MINAKEAWRISSEVREKQLEEDTKLQLKENAIKINDVKDLYQKVTSSLEKWAEEGFTYYIFHTKNEYLVAYVFEKLTALGYEVDTNENASLPPEWSRIEVIDPRDKLNTSYGPAYTVTIYWRYKASYKKPSLPYWLKWLYLKTL